jgi:hypothetical protein
MFFQGLSMCGQSTIRCDLNKCFSCLLPHVGCLFVNLFIWWEWILEYWFNPLRVEEKLPIEFVGGCMWR